jgi:hypothetical protein
MWEVRWFVGNEPSRFISLVDLFSASLKIAQGVLGKQKMLHCTKRAAMLHCNKAHSCLGNAT